MVCWSVSRGVREVWVWREIGEHESWRITGLWHFKQLWATSDISYNFCIYLNFTFYIFLYTMIDCFKPSNSNWPLFFYSQMFQGNKDRNSIVVASFPHRIATRFVKFTPKDFHGKLMCMRVEAIGCHPSAGIIMLSISKWIICSAPSNAVNNLMDYLQRSQ